MGCSRILPAISVAKLPPPPLFLHKNNRPFTSPKNLRSRTASFAFFPPTINDISTDLKNPPGFTSVTRGALPDSFKPQIEQGYADLKALEVKGKAGDVFEKALQVAKEQPRWEITVENKRAGAIEGVATTALLQFKDDFAIRIKQGRRNMTTVDMRSKSRTGASDLGANAARIRSYFKALKSKF